jgi:hypothetical protein
MLPLLVLQLLLLLLLCCHFLGTADAQKQTIVSDMKLRLKGSLTAVFCPSTKKIEIDADLFITNFGSYGNSVSEFPVRIIYFPCGNPVFTAELIPGRQLVTQIGKHINLTITEMAVTATDNLQFNGQLRGYAEMHNLFGITSSVRTSMYVTVVNNQLGVFQGSVQLRLPPVEMAGIVSLDFKKCDDGPAPWEGSLDVGFQLPASCLSLSGRGTYNRCANLNEAMYTVETLRPTSFILGGLGVQHVIVKLEGIKTLGPISWEGSISGQVLLDIESIETQAASDVAVVVKDNAIASADIGFKAISPHVLLSGRVSLNTRTCNEDRTPSRFALQMQVSECKSSVD